MADFNVGSLYYISTFTSHFPSEQSCFLPRPITRSFSCCFSTKAVRIPWSHLHLLCGFNGNNTFLCDNDAKYNSYKECHVHSHKSPDATVPNTTIIYKLRSFWATATHRRNDAKRGRNLL